MSARRLAIEVGVNKNTAWYMARRICLAAHEHRDFLEKIEEELEQLA
jgi:hypothetical protein